MDARRWAIVAGLALVLAGATAARFIDLGTNPGGLYPDEAAEGLAGRQILRDPTYRPVFVVEDAGREATYAYSLAVGFAIAGDNTITLRSVAALWGVLGALGAWLLGRRFGEGAGLAAGAWVAGSLWLIAISRDGMRNTITPFFCAVALSALLAWYSRPTRGRSLLAGACVALCSLYTYQALQLLPLLVVMWLLWIRRTEPERFSDLGRALGWFIVAFAAVGAPMILFAFTNPQAYFGRAVGVSAFNPSNVPEADALTHVLRTLGAFAFVGDPNARHNVGSFPMLGWPFAILAIVGLGALIAKRNDGRHALVLLSIPVFLIPPILATEGGSPHFLRSLGLAIPVAVTVSLGAQEIARWVAARLRSRLSELAGPVSVGAFAIGFVLFGLGGTSTYLQRPEADRRDAFSYDLVAMAQSARPTDIVIANEFEQFTIQYVHDDPMPTIATPGTSIQVRSGQRVLATSAAGLEASLGARAAGAAPIAWDNAGRALVWAVTVP